LGAGTFQAFQGRKLSGEEDIYRIRQRRYRLIYEVEGNKLLIHVLKIGHQNDIYK
jgi:mRNA-degrading endonuclease RelE of RelBE toxin-antitoxin system